MLEEEGAPALLTGLAPTVVGYGSEGALKFGAYEALKPAAASALLALGLGVEQSASLGPIASAVVAGGLASLVLAPAEATRIRMVSDPSYAAEGPNCAPRPSPLCATATTGHSPQVLSVPRRMRICVQVHRLGTARGGFAPVRTHAALEPSYRSLDDTRCGQG